MRRRLPLSWFVLVTATAVACAGALGIEQLQRHATESQQLRVLVAEMKSAAWQQSALEWEAIAEQRLTSSLARQHVESQDAANGLYRRLAVRDPRATEAGAVHAAFDSYFMAVDREFALLARGLIGDAEQLDAAEVDPAFDGLTAALTDADRHYGALAAQARARAWLGTILILLAAATVIGGLTWRLQQVRSRAHGRVAHQALHDALTGLPNRTLLHDRIAQVISQADRARFPAALLLIDLDRFKEVNDTLGHHRGDQLLVQVARRMAGAVRQGDTIARLGGDEFAVLLPRIGAVDEVAEVASRLRAVLQAPFLLDGLNVSVDASIGAALYPEQGTDADELLQRADIAMYAAKLGQTGFALFDSAHDHHSRRRLTLLAELRNAIENDQLVVYYQPKIDTHTQHVLGVEALVRWQHPDHGLIPPMEFIPLAEHTGLITPLTGFVLDTALGQCRTWLDAGRELAVAVNVSTRRLLDRDFPEEVAGLLARWQVPARLLELEITESAILTDPAQALHVLERLDALGVQLSIDDFGTGYSSMAHLQVMPIHELKVDRSFVATMTTNHRDAVIVRSTVELGRNLGLRVVAEGVEDANTWRELDAVGCDAIQGYYVSRPVPVAELDDWLSEHPAGVPVSPGRMTGRSDLRQHGAGSERTGRS
jgi:diguanylate cyclase (GGDEF)-like protein